MCYNRSPAAWIMFHGECAPVSPLPPPNHPRLWNRYEHGTHKTVTARFRPWLSGTSTTPLELFSRRSEPPIRMLIHASLCNNSYFQTSGREAYTMPPKRPLLASKVSLSRLELGHDFQVKFLTTLEGVPTSPPEI